MPIFSSESNVMRHRSLIAVGAVILLAMTALAAVATSSIHRLSLPVSPVLSAFAILVPLLNIPLLTNLVPYLTARRSSGPLALSRQQSVSRNPRLTLGTTVLLVVDAVLITLAATHIPSDSLSCNLGRTWERLFRNHDATAIRTIQDTLNCCGFNSPKHMAYPFPSKNVKVTACMDTYQRDQACGGAWMEKEKEAAGIFVAVGGVVAIFKVLAFMWAYYQEYRARQRGFFSEEGHNEEGLTAEARRRIEDVTEEVRGEPDSRPEPNERSLLLPAAARAAPWGDEGTAERERDTLI